MSEPKTKKIQTQCCIVGGGPAGMMLGFLLARAGVDVQVLEKHGDFLRDFRGDTIHPSTLELIYELGLLEEFLKLPHQKVSRLRGWIGGTEVTVADFSHLPTHCRFIAMMPQWDFLDFLADQARPYSSFHLSMPTEVTDLIEEAGRVVGVNAKSPEGNVEVRANLVVGTDGRNSIVREKAGMEVIDLGAPIDVLWMRLTRKPTDSDQAMGRFEAGRIFVMIYRGEYWQCGLVIPKNGFEDRQKKGLDALKREIVSVTPWLEDRVHELRDWNDVKLLTVKVDRLRQWHRPGVLCMGDAAHAMSPIGGVGINLAVQDAVAAANILARAFSRGTVETCDLEAIQRRRMLPTRLTQRIQVLAQNRIISRMLSSNQPLVVPGFIRWPIFPRITARLIGLGIRPEHIQTQNNGSLFYHSF